MDAGVDFEEKGDILIVRIYGRFIFEEANRQKEEIYEKLKNQTKVVFDLSKITLMCSVGLGVVLSCQALIQRQEGKLSLFGLNKDLQFLFAIERVDKVFKIFETEKEAIESFS